jgi:MFS family permease
MLAFTTLSQEVRQYILITFNYWAFTLTDGALRMLVVLYFHQLGYDPVSLALLFLFYEIFGVITNLIGGWLGAKLGLNTTMNMGLAIQLIALCLLLVPTEMLTVVWVMFAQALSGIAKDLNKMSAKSAIKLLIKNNDQKSLYQWVARLTGSKNSIKGLGFFVGGLLLSIFGFKTAILIMLIGLSFVWLLSLIKLTKDLGKAKKKPKFSQLFAKSRAVNLLSAARLFLFASRDIWFVVALPVFFAENLGWSHWNVGSFFACWIILYGITQTFAPRLTANPNPNLNQNTRHSKTSSQVNPQAAFKWSLWLTLVTLILAAVFISLPVNLTPFTVGMILVTGLLVFGFIFAINSSLHSYLIVSIANEDGVSLDVGFYYMANAMGRLIGTLLSGWLYLTAGLAACLLASALMLIITTFITKFFIRIKAYKD